MAGEVEKISPFVSKFLPTIFVISWADVNINVYLN